MTTSLSRCYRCHKQYSTTFEHQVLCGACRHYVVKQERRTARREQRVELSLIQIELEFDQLRRAEWDVMMIDENGRDVWAKDLAKRYRVELDARQRRDYRLRQDAKMS